MRERKSKFTFGAFLAIVFVIATLLLIFVGVIFKDINGSIIGKFALFYIGLTVLIILYAIVMAIWNLRKLKRRESIKRTLRFFILFILFGVINYLFDYFFRPARIDLFRELSIESGISFGIVFWDIIFLKNS